MARVHEIDRHLLDAVWSQHEAKEVTRKGLVWEARGQGSQSMTALRSLARQGGFSIDFHVRFRELTPGQTLFDARAESGRGIALTVGERFNLQLTMNDGARTFVWESDYGTHEGTLKVGRWQHVAVVVDGGARIVSFVIDGQFNDGGATRQFGWGRFPADLGDVNGSRTALIAPKSFAEVGAIRFYDRYLLTSEAVGNWRAGNRRA